MPGWNGKSIGDCIATISSKVLRVVAFQAAGSIGETEERVNDAVKQIIPPPPSPSLPDSDTPICFVSRSLPPFHLRVVIPS